MKCIYKLALLIIFSSHAGALELRKCLDSSSAKWDQLTKTDYDAGYYPSCVVEAEEDGIVFTFDGSIGKTNYKKGELIVGWPLTPWAYEPIEPAVLERYEEVRRAFSTLRSGPSHPLGCLNKTPLRYGDIEGDGKNELVIVIGNELLLFSPEAQKTVFALNMRVDDWMTEAETQAHFEYYPLMDDDAFIPYYQSAANGDYASVLPGYRGYGKLYAADYDKNGKADIIAWRKLYISRTLSATKGFDKVSDTYYHYEKAVSGEYVLRDTAQATIQNWLSAANLTWQKGFPSQSECAGEEGKLIPEMHDPLLNDPDVQH